MHKGLLKPYKKPKRPSKYNGLEAVQKLPSQTSFESGMCTHQGQQHKGQTHSFGHLDKNTDRNIYGYFTRINN